MTLAQEVELICGMDHRVVTDARDVLRENLDKLAAATNAYPVICVIGGHRWVFECRENIECLLALLDAVAITNKLKAQNSGQRAQAL